jgi:hypothetical protein
VEAALTPAALGKAAIATNILRWELYARGFWVKMDAIPEGTR